MFLMILVNIGLSSDCELWHIKSFNILGFFSFQSFAKFSNQLLFYHVISLTICLVVYQCLKVL